jgi:hypothetical protein
MRCAGRGHTPSGPFGRADDVVLDVFGVYGHSGVQIAGLLRGDVRIDQPGHGVRRHSTLPPQDWYARLGHERYAALWSSLQEITGDTSRR